MEGAQEPMEEEMEGSVGEESFNADDIQILDEWESGDFYDMEEETEVIDTASPCHSDEDLCNDMIQSLNNDNIPEATPQNDKKVNDVTDIVAPCQINDFIQSSNSNCIQEQSEATPQNDMEETNIDTFSPCMLKKTQDDIITQSSSNDNTTNTIEDIVANTDVELVEDISNEVDRMIDEADRATNENSNNAPLSANAVKNLGMEMNEGITIIDDTSTEEEDTLASQMNDQTCEADRNTGIKNDSIIPDNLDKEDSSNVVDEETANCPTSSDRNRNGIKSKDTNTNNSLPAADYCVIDKETINTEEDDAVVIDTTSQEEMESESEQHGRTISDSIIPQKEDIVTDPEKETNNDTEEDTVMHNSQISSENIGSEISQDNESIDHETGQEEDEQTDQDVDGVKRKTSGVDDCSIEKITTRIVVKMEQVDDKGKQIQPEKSSDDEEDDCVIIDVPNQEPDLIDLTELETEHQESMEDRCKSDQKPSEDKSDWEIDLEMSQELDDSAVQNTSIDALNVKKKKDVNDEVVICGLRETSDAAVTKLISPIGKIVMIIPEKKMKDAVIVQMETEELAAKVIEKFKNKLLPGISKRPLGVYYRKEQEKPEGTDIYFRLAAQANTDIERVSTSPVPILTSQAARNSRQNVGRTVTTAGPPGTSNAEIMGITYSPPTYTGNVAAASSPALKNQNTKGTAVLKLNTNKFDFNPNAQKISFDNFNINNIWLNEDDQIKRVLKLFIFYTAPKEDLKLLYDQMEKWRAEQKVQTLNHLTGAICDMAHSFSTTIVKAGIYGRASFLHHDRRHPAIIVDNIPPCLELHLFKQIFQQMCSHNKVICTELLNMWPIGDHIPITTVVITFRKGIEETLKSLVSMLDQKSLTGYSDYKLNVRLSEYAINGEEAICVSERAKKEYRRLWPRFSGILKIEDAHKPELYMKLMNNCRSDSPLQSLVSNAVKLSNFVTMTESGLRHHTWKSDARFVKSLKKKSDQNHIYIAVWNSIEEKKKLVMKWLDTVPEKSVDKILKMMYTYFPLVQLKEEALAKFAYLDRCWLEIFNLPKEVYQHETAARGFVNGCLTKHYGSPSTGTKDCYVERCILAGTSVIIKLSAVSIMQQLAKLLHYQPINQYFKGAVGQSRVERYTGPLAHTDGSAQVAETKDDEHVKQRRPSVVTVEKTTNIEIIEKEYNRRLTVYGLAGKDEKKDAVEKHFSKYGDVEKCQIFKPKHGLNNIAISGDAAQIVFRRSWMMYKALNDEYSGSKQLQQANFKQFETGTQNIFPKPLVYLTDVPRSVTAEWVSNEASHYGEVVSVLKRGNQSYVLHMDSMKEAQQVMMAFRHFELKIDHSEVRYALNADMQKGSSVFEKDVCFKKELVVKNLPQYMMARFEMSLTPLCGTVKSICYNPGDSNEHFVQMKTDQDAQTVIANFDGKRFGGAAKPLEIRLRKVDFGESNEIQTIPHIFEKLKTFSIFNSHQTIEALKSCQLMFELEEKENLKKKICTFKTAGKEPLNQKWYVCDSCPMAGMPICQACSKSCHDGHKVEFRKYSPTYCCCGAKEDGSCQASLVSHETDLVSMSSALAVIVRHPCFRDFLVLSEKTSPKVNTSDGTEQSGLKTETLRSHRPQQQLLSQTCTDRQSDFMTRPETGQGLRSQPKRLYKQDEKHGQALPLDDINMQHSQNPTPLYNPLETPCPSGYSGYMSSDKALHDVHPPATSNRQNEMDLRLGNQPIITDYGHGRGEEMTKGIAINVNSQHILDVETRRIINCFNTDKTPPLQQDKEPWSGVCNVSLSDRWAKKKKVPTATLR